MKERKVDVAFWPTEQEAGLAVFRQLQQRLELDAFDDGFLRLLEDYRGLYPDSEHIDIFAGYFAFYYGEYDGALEFGLKA